LNEYGTEVCRTIEEIRKGRGLSHQELLIQETLRHAFNLHQIDGRLEGRPKVMHIPRSGKDSQAHVRRLSLDRSKLLNEIREAASDTGGQSVDNDPHPYP
jgi:hypothetical protein